MTNVDFFVLGIYLAGVFVVGLIFSRRNQTSADMFNASGGSPWWASGLSAFMTMFSANTFVVWGGIAYRQGMVAVSINLMYGVSAILCGWFVAGRWKKLGVQTPADFVELRYGVGALHFFTWFMTALRMIGTAGALYALGRIMVAVLVGEFTPGSDLSNDPRLYWAISIFGIVVVIYTMFGGLWAVLMTDVMQFIVLNIAILFVIPLALIQVGGIDGFLEKANAQPVVYADAGEVVIDESASMLSAVSGDYSLLFLAGWCAIHFFVIGAEWAFAQRFICVKDSTSARRSAYLFGALYLLSPILWLLPPMLWRLQNPIPANATPSEISFLAENAYILSCRSVLPIGMVGLMVAAMFSATASMVSSQLNVFSGVLTHNIYRPLFSKCPSDRHLLNAGRLFTALLGLMIVGIACAIPSMGGAEKVIVEITELMVTALLAPTVWGLFSRRVDAKAVYITGLLGLTIGIGVRLVSQMTFEPGEYVALEYVATWITSNGRSVKTIAGVVVPIMIMIALQLTSRGISKGWQAIERQSSSAKDQLKTVDGSFDPVPAKVVAGVTFSCGAILIALIAFNSESISMLAGFGGFLLALATSIYFVVRKYS